MAVQHEEADRKISRNYTSRKRIFNLYHENNFLQGEAGTSGNDWRDTENHLREERWLQGTATDRGNGYAKGLGFLLHSSAGANGDVSRSSSFQNSIFSYIWKADSKMEDLQPPFFSRWRNMGTAALLGRKTDICTHAVFQKSHCVYDIVQK